MHLRLAGMLLLTGCATPAVRPDASVDLTGEWQITAVDGRSAPEGMTSFLFRYEPPHGFAQFACNSGSGATTVKNGWLITRDWIMTVAGCLEERRPFERGFDILAQPLAIERRGGTAVLLRNDRGSIFLKRLAPLALAGTEWRIVNVNGHNPPKPDRAFLRFGVDRYDGTFGCNGISGDYRLEGAQLAPSLPVQTERTCESPASGAISVMEFEQSGLKVLRSGGRIQRSSIDGLTLISNEGRIELKRR